MTSTIIALIAAQPGPLRDSLETLLKTIPQIEIVAQARDESALLHWGEKIQPDLIVIEAKEGMRGTDDLLARIFVAWESTRTIVLADTTTQKRAAEAAGADVVLLKGFKAITLVQHIECLLNSKINNETPDLPAIEKI